MHVICAHRPFCVTIAVSFSLTNSVPSVRNLVVISLAFLEIPSRVQIGTLLVRQTLPMDADAPKMYLSVVCRLLRTLLRTAANIGGSHGCYSVYGVWCVWCIGVYRVIHKSLRDFRTRLRNNQDTRQKGAYQ